MKLLVASDIHGSAYYAEKLIERYYEEKAQRLILLGDILYHGPRNDLPKQYDPKKVIALLNPLAPKILCIKGNCDSDVDGMVRDFPIDSENALLCVGERTYYLTHGHKIRPDTAKLGCILLNGHTHVPLCDESEGYLHLNPGSVSIPKENSPHSYMVLDGDDILWKDAETGQTYRSYRLK